jgi:hypothetical protein
MTILFVLMCISFITIAYGFYTAPFMDDKGKITKPGKKLTDLFK